MSEPPVELQRTLIRTQLQRETQLRIRTRLLQFLMEQELRQTLTEVLAIRRLNHPTLTVAHLLQ